MKKTICFMATLIATAIILLTTHCTQRGPLPAIEASPTPVTPPAATPAATALPNVPWTNREIYRSGLTEDAQSVLTGFRGPASTGSTSTYPMTTHNYRGTKPSITPTRKRHH